MKITKDTLVVLDYRILDQSGTLFEEGKGREATDYIHGYGELPAGVEEALDGGPRPDSRNGLRPPRP